MINSGCLVGDSVRVTSRRIWIMAVKRQGTALIKGWRVVCRPRLALSFVDYATATASEGSCVEQVEMAGEAKEVRVDASG